jgi:hypothetical protein
MDTTFDDDDENEKKDGTGATPMHSFFVSGTKFLVDRRYTPIKPVGTGAYGIVV